MSVDIKFNKRITLNMLREKTDFKFEYYNESDLWVISKLYDGDDEEQFLQLVIGHEEGCDEYGTFESDGDIPIYEFVYRYRGGLMLREISKLFNALFLTDAEEEELFYMGDEINDWDDNDWREWRYNSYRVAMRGFYLDYDSEYNVIDYEGDDEDVNDKVSVNDWGVHDEDGFKKVIEDDGLDCSIIKFNGIITLNMLKDRCGFDIEFRDGVWYLIKHYGNNFNDELYLKYFNIDDINDNVISGDIDKDGDLNICWFCSKNSYNSMIRDISLKFDLLFSIDIYEQDLIFGMVDNVGDDVYNNLVNECYKKSMDYYNLSFDDNNHVIEINDDLPF